MTDTRENDDHPKWLLELENRKRKPRLAHEAGAGASCVICKDTCPGLDLHFWRKTCKNCKCSKDDHDVNDEDFPQFDLLFGSSKKYKKKPTLLRIHNRKDQAQEAFEWIPPDTTKEIATEYMKALPAEKLPIKGSAGAALRRQLLQKQLPLHDIEYDVCDKLSEQEKKHFEKYLENIKKYVGQGAVTKMLSARPFDRLLMTPANATDMQLCSPQNKHDTPKINMVQLRTPSSFMAKTPYKKDLHAKLDIYESSLPVSTTLNNSGATPIRERCNRIGNNCEVVKSEPVKGERFDHLKCFDSESVTPSRNSFEYFDELSKCKNPSTSPSHSKSINDDDDDEAFIAESILADALLPPSTVHTNDIIGSTLDRKGLMFIREKLANRYGNQGNYQPQMPCNTSSFAKDCDTSDLLRNHVTSQSINNDNENDDVKTIIAATRTTYPSGVSSLSQGNVQSVEKNTVQSTGIDGENEIMRTKFEKLESTPLDLMASHSNLMKNSPLPIPSFQTCTQYSNANNHQAKLDNFTVPSTIIHSEKLHNHPFPGQSIVYGVGTNQPEHLEGAIENLTINPAKQQKCHKCEEVICVGDVAVIAEKAKNAMWHPGCFVCDTCNELLVDLVYFYYKNKLYCGRDLPSLMGIPRCFACDELIFLREYTVAEGHNYHVKHFCCWDCDIPLAGKQYTTENDRPLCLPCYQKTYAKTCNTCNNVIAADQQGVALKDLNFHATGVCFRCYICKKNLLQARTAVKDKKLFCSKECIAMFLQPTT
ncbi:testin LIM domain protein [Halictus rubicundus]|uniref:testin LIM domain protein n=1 Tax=Halictus rubicundus TaxID=77578 RepID=UPI004035304E